MPRQMDTTGYTHKDKELEQKVQSAIYQELQDSGRDITVKAQDGLISLWGVVDVLAEKISAEKVARHVFGVHGVDNGLTVALENYLSDKDISELVADRLAQSPDPDISKLGADTHDGVVYLRGHSESLGKVREAEKIAAGVKGVKEIVSEVKVGEHHHLDDATITNAVERALSVSGTIDCRKVTTSTHNGVVTLQGMLDTIDEIEEAVEIAYDVPGVRAVKSEIHARHGAEEGDRALTNKLRDMLSGQVDMSRGTLQAHVVGGTAYLTGEVFDIDQKIRVEELTRQLDGITGISNSIQVSGHLLS